MYIQRHYFSVKWEGVEFVRYIIKTFYIVYIWYAQLFKSMQYKKGVKNTGIVNIYTYTWMPIVTFFNNLLKDINLFLFDHDERTEPIIPNTKYIDIKKYQEL